MHNGEDNMSLRETFTEWAQKYNPEQLNELTPPGQPGIPYGINPVKDKHYRGYSQLSPQQGPDDDDPMGWYDTHPVPYNWLNLLNNMHIDWTAYPIDWSGILPFLHEGPEGTWSGQGPGGETYTVTAILGVSGEFVGWLYT